MNYNRDQPDIRVFQEKAEHEFGYLVKELGFFREPIRDHAGLFEIAYSDGRTRIAIQGTDWGLNARVAFGNTNPDNTFENYDLEDLAALRGTAGLTPPGRGSVKGGSKQIEQLAFYAQLLHSIGQDILEGDHNIFAALNDIRQARIDKLDRDS